MKFFNKTSASFLVRFALILSVSFAVILVVNFYLSEAAEPSSIEEYPVGIDKGDTEGADAGSIY